MATRALPLLIDCYNMISICMLERCTAWGLALLPPFFRAMENKCKIERALKGNIV
jgi:hypothetical protein